MFKFDAVGFGILELVTNAQRGRRNAHYNHPSQPVVGVCWYEARAYCSWLSAQTGRSVRLPTEVQWEAAARGMEARTHAYGDAFDRLAANTIETHVKRTTPVGVFPSGRTPDGADDLSGNVNEWTSSLLGGGDSDDYNTLHAYPYEPTDGREDPEADPSVNRVLRGGTWYGPPSLARASGRIGDAPTPRSDGYGLRVVVLPSPILNH